MTLFCFIIGPHTCLGNLSRTTSLHPKKRATSLGLRKSKSVGFLESQGQLPVVTSPSSIPEHPRAIIEPLHGVEANCPRGLSRRRTFIQFGKLLNTHDGPTSCTFQSTPNLDRDMKEDPCSSQPEIERVSSLIATRLPPTAVKAPSPETFVQTIEDLEHLLNEALLIAKRAVERERLEALPAVLASAAITLERNQPDIGRPQLRQQTIPTKSSSITGHHNARSSFTDLSTLRSTNAVCNNSSVVDEVRFEDKAQDTSPEFSTPSSTQVVINAPYVLRKRSKLQHTEQKNYFDSSPTGLTGESGATRTTIGIPTTKRCESPELVASS